MPVDRELAKAIIENLKTEHLNDVSVQIEQMKNAFQDELEEVEDDDSEEAKDLQGIIDYLEAAAQDIDDCSNNLTSAL
jgi:hypothetical protein